MSARGREVVGYVVRERVLDRRYSNPSGWGPRGDARVYRASDRTGAHRHAKRWGAVVVRLTREADS